MFGNGSLSAAIRKARLRLSRRAPETRIKRHGCTLEFEGARCAIASASSSNAGGTGRARKLRIDRRSRMTWSRIDACSRYCIFSNLNRRTTPALNLPFFHTIRQRVWAPLVGYCVSLVQSCCSGLTHGKCDAVETQNPSTQTSISIPGF